MIVAVVSSTWRVAIEDLEALEELCHDLANRTQETVELERTFAEQEEGEGPKYLGVSAVVVYDENEEPDE